MSVRTLLRGLLAVIAPEQKRGWKVVVEFLDGTSRDDVAAVEMTNPRIGQVVYGWNPAGYDQFMVLENGGGGSVTVPYALIDGQLYVGGVFQNRPNMGGVKLCAIGGFLKSDESHFVAAGREASEEVGFTEPATLLLTGEPGCWNRALSVTNETDEGTHFYGLGLDPKCLAPAEEGTYAIDPQILKPVSKSAESIVKARLVHWKIAARVADQFLNAAVARLIAYLDDQKSE